MTPHQIVGLAVRLFSVWLVFVAFQFIGNSVSVNNQPGMEPSNSYLVSAAVVLGIAVALWLFPMFVAHKLIPRTQFDNVLRVPASEAAMVACVVLGLWLFAAHVLPSLAYYISLAVLINAQGKPLTSSVDFTFVRIGAAAIELAVAAVLCFKAHAISKFFITERALPEDA
jgi:hypothetical protein